MGFVVMMECAMGGRWGAEWQAVEEQGVLLNKMYAVSVVRL